MEKTRPGGPTTGAMIGREGQRYAYVSREQIIDAALEELTEKEKRAREKAEAECRTQT